MSSTRPRKIAGKPSAATRRRNSAALNAKLKASAAKQTAAEKKGAKIIAENIAKHTAKHKPRKKKYAPSPPGWYIPNSDTSYPNGVEGLKAYGPNAERQLHRLSRDQPVIVILDGVMLRLQIIDDELHIIKNERASNPSIFIRGDRLNSIYVK